jgi:hypothetical protein
LSAIEAKLCHIAGFGQPLGGFGFGLALGQHRLGHVHGGDLAFRVEAHDQIALIDRAALFDRQLRDDATDAGG